MRKLFCIILVFVALTGFKTERGWKVTGTVTEAGTGVPIPGATVRVENMGTGVATNSAGKYAVSIPKAHNILLFSAIGYKTEKVEVRSDTVINIALHASGNQLVEVVVTGYGIRRKTSVTEAVSSVNGASLAANNGYTAGRPPVARELSASIQGKVSGVYIRGAASTSQYKAPQIITPTDPGEESYGKINENGFNLAKDVPLSTFSVDVDGTSYSNVRRYINNGQLPPVDAVRIEEMINYFSYDLSGPSGNSPVAIHTELSSAPWNPRHRLVRIALKARTIPEDKLPPSNLVFLIDVSGSMNMENKLPLVKSAMKMLVDKLRPQDKVSIVTYAGQAGIDLQPTRGDRKAIIDSAIDILNADGSTNGGEGIKMAYKLARENFMEDGNNRIIMATDGDFNVGSSSDEDMETLITKERVSDVDLSIMGFGMGNIKDSKMETLADKGNGNYFYIDNIDEARKALVSEFGGTLFTVAKDVKLQVEFNPGKVQAYRLLGYEDRLLNKEDFNNDRKDAGDMGSGHTVTALYEIVPAGIKDDQVGWVDPLKYQKTESNTTYNGSDELLTVKFRYKQPQSLQSELSQAVIRDDPKAFGKTSADFKFATAVVEFGMLLRDSQYKQKATYDQAISIAEEGKGNDKDGYRSEFIRLAESAKLLTKSALASQ